MTSRNYFQNIIKCKKSRAFMMKLINGSFSNLTNFRGKKFFSQFLITEAETKFDFCVSELFFSNIFFPLLLISSQLRNYYYEWNWEENSPTLASSYSIFKNEGARICSGFASTWHQPERQNGKYRQNRGVVIWQNIL